VLVDAWGMLTTPLGTYSVLRSKETKITKDSADGKTALGWRNVLKTKDSTTTYSWWTNGIGYSLATATMDSTNGVKSVQFLTTIPPTGITELTAAADEKVYPNPAQNEINFVADASKQKEIKVYDIAGRLLDAVMVNNTVTTFNTSAYANGIYTYSIIGKDNTVLARGKFVINK
jgi:hypothetical protein